MPAGARLPAHDSRAALQSALANLYGRIPLGMRLDLDPMRAACAQHGHPERAWRAVHVAGTNGKGSVCAMVEAIARAHGLRTGLYTSPHLCRFAERIRLDGEPIDDSRLASLLERVLGTSPELSFFEAATLTAFVAFREAEVDVAVVEVGIGGRLDATNVLPTPAAAAITRIALDHTERLGPTLVDIAREKAGIAKPGLDIVLGPMLAPVRLAIDEVARDRGATTSTPAETVLPVLGLRGDHQKDNARIAAELGARLGASRAAVVQGLACARWPARLERIGPYLLDAAHNPDGAEALAHHVRGLSVSRETVALVFGTLADKDWRSMLGTLAPLAAARVYVAPRGSARSAADPGEMRALHAGQVATDLEAALAAAAATHPALIIVAGSMVLVGEARASLGGLPRDPPVAL
jgi:dihydrofolate synthase/folylpolyglutamate synthase